MVERYTNVSVNDLLNGTRAVEFLGVSKMTLWRWVRNGKIQPVMLDDRAYYHIEDLRKLKTEKPDEVESSG